MFRSTIVAAAVAVALATASVTQAGFDGSSGLSFTQMMVGGGYVDFENPEGGYADFLSQEDPLPGSHLDASASHPAFGSLAAGISFGSFNNGVALFSFWSDLDAVPFGDLPYADIAFAGSRISFTTTVPVLVTLIGSVQATETGVGFFELYADDDIDGEFFTPGDNPVVFQLELGPGSYDLAMGAAALALGGFGSFEGTLAISVIPSPGAFALLGAAGLLARRRRR
jgi:hypothetical protein